MVETYLYTVTEPSLAAVTETAANIQSEWGIMASSKLTLTKKAIQEAPVPKAGRDYLRDDKEAGLEVQITPTGKKTFQVRGQYKRRDIRVTLGECSLFSMEQARNWAKTVKSKLAQGINPNEEKRQQRAAEERAKAEMTFADLFALYLERHSRPNKRSWKDDTLAYQTYLASPFGTKKVSAVKREDVIALHSRIAKEGKPTRANRVLALISSVFGRAIEWGILHENPCLGIRKHKEQARERFLSGDELRRLFEALEEEANIVCRDFFLVALLTGARRTNVLEMKWSDIDFSASIWSIPQTKNGTPQTVPLVPAVIEVLQRRLEAKLKTKLLNPFVFPGHGKTGHLVEPKSAWKRICERAGIEGVRIHDLRRTFGSWQAITGASLPIIGKTLNHKSQSATAIYARLDLDPVRASMEKAAQSMLGCRGAVVHKFPEKVVGG